MTDPRSLAILNIVAELASADRYTETEAVARAVQQAAHDAGQVFFMGDGPWFGLRDEVDALLDEGLLDEGGDVAEYGRQTRRAERVWLTVTPAGRAVLTEDHPS